jgi:uroporphyrinogen decarboxylase
MIIPTDPQETRRLLEAAYGQPDGDPMTPYQRVQAALELRPSDRVPFDFWAVPETIDKLKAYLRTDSEEEVLRLLGVDCRVFSPAYAGPEPERLPDGTFYTTSGSHRRVVKNEFSSYEEYASFPLAEAASRAEVEGYARWPDPALFDWEGLAERIRAANTGVRYHIRVDVGGIFESAWALYGLDRFLTDLIEAPEVPEAIMDCYTDIMIANVRHMARACPGLVDWVYTYDDVAIQDQLLMSPRMWRKHILPRHQRLNAVIKEEGYKILYHSCGAIYPLIGALIDEMGIDALNPLQPRSRWMDMAQIKREFGSRIAFHGAIDLQHTLPFGTQSEVADEVISRCRVLGAGGGYICTSAHYIQADVPVENIMAMYLADRKSRG